MASIATRRLRALAPTKPGTLAFAASAAAETATDAPRKAPPPSLAAAAWGPLLEQPALKRLLLRLGKTLQNGRLPASDLPPVPQLLQRIELQDEGLFQDFCTACGRSWQELSAADLAKLLRGTEDYGLLHATEGPAVARLAKALQESLEAGQSLPALASLCSAALSVRNRGLMRPLLLQVQSVLESKVQEPASLSPSDAAALLEGLSMLHAALGGSSEALGKALDVARRSAAKAELPPEGLLSAAGRSYWHFPEAASDLVAELGKRLELGESELRAARSLPALLRLRLLDVLLREKKPAELAEKATAATAEAWLLLLHDLPSSAQAAGEGERAKAAGALAKALLERLFGEEGLTELVKGKEPEYAVLAAAHLCASSAAFAGVEGCSIFAEEALSSLNGCWGRLTPRDVQSLFRTPCAESAAQVARQGLAAWGAVQEARVKVALLQGAALALPAEEVQPHLASLPTSLAGAQKPLALEAALRRGPLADREECRPVLEALRAEGFRATLDALLVWNQRPARGFIQHVEQVLRRNRAGPEAAEVAASEASEAAVVEPLASEAVPVPSATGKDLVPDDDRPPEGIQWHRGLKAYEVRLEVQGRRVLGGYFQPPKEDDEGGEPSEEARKLALQAAIEHRRSLELHYFGQQRGEGAP